jgi:hypothetical protein
MARALYDWGSLHVEKTFLGEIFRQNINNRALNPPWGLHNPLTS